jgi:hypothetical protein
MKRSAVRGSFLTLLVALAVSGAALAQGKKPGSAPPPPPPPPPAVAVPIVPVVTALTTTVPEGAPSAVRPNMLRGWFSMEGVKTEPCALNAKCVVRWDNRANPQNPATSNLAFRPFVDTIGTRSAVRFGLSPKPDGWSPRLTPLTFDASSLAGRPYTVIAVVARHRDKPENYFFGTTGRNCGLAGCEAKTGLHIGWRGNTTLTVDPYGNGEDLTIPAFVSRERFALVTATAGPGHRRLQIEDAGVVTEVFKTDFAPLVYAKEGTIGLGANYRSNLLATTPDCEGHCFSGALVELVIYSDNLAIGPEGRATSADVELVKAYLRKRHDLPAR